MKNISIKSLDLLPNEYIFKDISSHQNCKCKCLLDKKVCNNLQKFNKNKCRCECLIVKNVKMDIHSMSIIVDVKINLLN